MRPYSHLGFVKALGAKGLLLVELSASWVGLVIQLQLGMVQQPPATTTQVTSDANNHVWCMHFIDNNVWLDAVRWSVYGPGRYAMSNCIDVYCEVGATGNNWQTYCSNSPSSVPLVKTGLKALSFLDPSLSFFCLALMLRSTSFFESFLLGIAAPYSSSLWPSSYDNQISSSMTILIMQSVTTKCVVVLSMHAFTIVICILSTV